jgi:hypothetical protein
MALGVVGGDAVTVAVVAEVVLAESVGDAIPTAVAAGIALGVGGDAVAVAAEVIFGVSAGDTIPTAVAAGLALGADGDAVAVAVAATAVVAGVGLGVIGGDAVTVAVAVGAGVLLIAVAGDAATVESGDAGGGVEAVAVADGLAEGDSLGDADGEGVGIAFFFVVDFLRCFGFGVGVGLTKNLLILSPKDSPSAVPRACTATAIDPLNAITSNKRIVILIPMVSYLPQRGQFLQHSLIHSYAGVEILERKIFVRRMRPAIMQCQPE